MLDFAPLDYAALAWFLVAWIGYTWIADRSRWRARSITAVINRYRRQWMRVMLRRDNRIFDSTIIGNLLNGTAFFASTSIFAIGALLAGLGATDSAIAVLRDLPITEAPSRTLWEVKVLTLVTIFVYAFFKFAWTFRLMNYCSILIGATPVEIPASSEAEDVADRAARVGGLAGEHFTRGIRAYFFALAALGWFIHPALFIATTTLVIYVLYRREFRSRSLRAIAGPGPGAPPEG